MAKRKKYADKVRHNKARLIAALEKSLGIVSHACREVGLDRQTFYNYCADPEFKKEVDGIQDLALDFAESQLFKQINNGEVSSTIFYLKTKGKRRGYIEKTETEITERVIKVVRE